MGEVMNYDELRRAFADEWILLGDPETDEATYVTSGRVLFHSPDRDEVYAKAIELRLPRIGFFFTGRPGVGKVIIL